MAYISELYEYLNEVRKTRARIVKTSNVKWNLQYDEEKLLDKEKEILRVIRDAEERPPLGEGLILLLNDTIKTYEHRLMSVDEKFKNQKGPNRLVTYTLLTLCIILQVIGFTI